MRISLLIVKKYLSLSNFLLVLILLVSAFFRFYNTPARYGFDFDPTRDALIITYAAKYFHLPLIGAASGIAPITFGPWYYYQMIIWQIIFPFTYSAWYLVGITSVLVSFFLYKIGGMLENKWYGLILALFAAISPSETGQTQGLSNPDLIPIYSTLIIWMFVRFSNYKNADWKWLFMWGFLLSIGINIHYQMLGLILLPIFYFILYHKNNILKVSSFTIGFFLPWIPLVIFNVLTNWSTLTGTIYFTHNHGYIANGWKLYLSNFWLPFWSYIWGVNNLIGILIFLFTLIIFIYLLVRKKLSTTYLILISVFLINFLILRYAIAQRDYYYYLYLHSLIFIFFATALWQIKKIKFGLLVISLLIFVITISMLGKDFIPLQARKDQSDMLKMANMFINQSNGKKITLFACGKAGQNYVQGVEFFLMQTNKLSDNTTGARYGIADFSCPLKLTSTIITVDLRSSSLKDINKQGWKLITPEIVYNNTLEWWKK